MSPSNGDKVEVDEPLVAVEDDVPQVYPLASKLILASLW